MGKSVFVMLTSRMSALWSFGARGLARHQRAILGILGILGVLVPWQLLADAGVLKSVIFSSPLRAASVLVGDARNGTLAANAAVSLIEWGLGFSLAALVGTGIGLIAGWVPHVRNVVMPWLQVLYVAPLIAFIPMTILWFGIGLTFKVFVVFVLSVFFIAVNTSAGVQSTEREYVSVSRTFGASRLTTFRTVIIPGSIPYIMTGLRQGSGMALVGVVVAEFISSNVGIGFMIEVAGARLDSARVIVGLFVLAGFGVFVQELLGRIERYFERWRVDTFG